MTAHYHHNCEPRVTGGDPENQTTSEQIRYRLENINIVYLFIFLQIEET